MRAVVEDSEAQRKKRRVDDTLCIACYHSSNEHQAAVAELSLGKMNISFNFCGALGKLTQNRRNAFTACCKNGKVCLKPNEVSASVPNSKEKNEAIYFLQDLFNIFTDSSNSFTNIIDLVTVC